MRAPSSPAPDRGERRSGPGPAGQVGLFRSVLCGVDQRANSRAACDQARLLASPGGTIECVPAARLTCRGGRALRDAAAHYDLVALGAGVAVCAAVRHARVPVLIARWCIPGTELTDRILVPVDASADSRRAVEVAGLLVAAHGGGVTLLGSAGGDAARQRAIAASRRLLLHATGAVPALTEAQLPRRRAIAVAAVDRGASLLVLGVGADADERRTAAQLADRVGCSMLALPAAGPVLAERFARGQRPAAEAGRRSRAQRTRP